MTRAGETNTTAKDLAWLPAVEQCQANLGDVMWLGPLREAVLAAFGPGHFVVARRKTRNDRLVRCTVYWVVAGTGDHKVIGAFCLSVIDADVTKLRHPARRARAVRTDPAAPVAEGAAEGEAVCPVPSCGRRVPLTDAGRMVWHADRYGFSCDGSGLMPAKAARLEIDAAGRLVGVDEKKMEVEDS